jgi:hypothetical protein
VGTQGARRACPTSPSSTAAAWRRRSWASKARTLGGKLKAFPRLRPKDLGAADARDRGAVDGLTMGQSAEKMAKENGITRESRTTSRI